jgi:hypothetical protein
VGTGKILRRYVDFAATEGVGGGTLGCAH